MTRNETIFVAALFAIVIFTAAMIPDNPKSKIALQQPSPVDWSTVTDDPNEKLDLTWLGIPIHIGGSEDAWIVKNLEETFNVDLKPVFMDANGYQKRRPLMLVGGEVPDVMWDGDPLQVRMNRRNGFIMELPYEVILKYAPTYVKFLNESGKQAWLYAHAEGKNYGLPTFNNMVMGPRISTWRKDWLDNVGISKVPETIEEMGEAFRRFRYDDPDGNGEQDTYGWSPDITHWSLMFAEIFAAYDTLAFDFIERDGRVVWGGVLPEAKEALAVMRGWYEEGLLEPDFVLNTRNHSTSLINGRIGYDHPIDNMTDYDLESAGSTLGKTVALNPGAELVPGPPLRNRAGLRRGRSWGGAAHVMQFGKHLENEPEKVIRVLKMMEAIASDPELYIQARSGKEGLHWRPDEAKGRETLEPYKSDKRLGSAELLGATNFFFPSNIYDEMYMSKREIAWNAANKKPEWSMINVLGKSDVVPSASRYLGDLRNWQVTTFVEIVVGDRPLDYFDTFVKEWHRRGGDVLTEEANQMYAQMKKIYKTVGAEVPQ